MKFKKYPKMFSDYHVKQINEHLEYNPSCKDAIYIYQIKYDGSNISFCFAPGEKMRIAKRSGFIDQYDNFNGILDIIEQYREVINRLQKYCDINNCEIQLYGEIFGKGIQNRINYGDDKYIKFFDMRKDGILLTLQELECLEEIVPLNHWAYSSGFYNLNEIGDIKVPKEHEGVVFKQYNRIYFFDRLLYIKKKNEQFKEKLKPKKNKKNKETDSNPETERLKELFLQYINHNRLKNVFSKHGKISKPEQIGEYIKLVSEDVIEDFQLENNLSNYNRAKMNEVFKIGNKEIISLLKEYL